MDVEINYCNNIDNVRITAYPDSYYSERRTPITG